MKIFRSFGTINLVRKFQLVYSGCGKYLPLNKSEMRTKCVYNVIIPVLRCGPTVFYHEKAPTLSLMTDSFIHMYNLHQLNFTKFTQIPLLSGKFQISPFSETFFCLLPLPASPVDSLCRLFCVLVRPPLLPSPCPGSLGLSSPNVYVVGLNTRVSMSCSLKGIGVARMRTVMLRQL